MAERFSIRTRVNSVKYALCGIADLLKMQHNARIHLVATAGVIGLASYYGIERWEWMIVLLTVGTVWMAEALNTAVEYLADACVSEPHPLIKRAKDCAAAAVLIVAVVALMVGVAIFYPYWFG
jgi:diacylglycerol kinase